MIRSIIGNQLLLNCVVFDLGTTISHRVPLTYTIDSDETQSHALRRIQAVEQLKGCSGAKGSRCHTSKEPRRAGDPALPRAQGRDAAARQTGSADPIFGAN